jgi:hypothetical protein
MRPFGPSNVPALVHVHDPSWLRQKCSANWSMIRHPELA